MSLIDRIDHIPGDQGWSNLKANKIVNDIAEKLKKEGAEEDDIVGILEGFYKAATHFKNIASIDLDKKIEKAAGAISDEVGVTAKKQE